MIRLLLRIALWSAVAIGAVIVAVGIALAIGIPVNLEPFREPAEAAASRSLGRRVTLAGPIELVPAFYPTFEIRDVRIGNPADWEGGPDEGFARLGLARLEVGMLPLLWGRALVEIRIEDLELLLETLPDGRENWRFIPDAEERAEQEQPQSAQEAAGAGVAELADRWIDDVELGALELHRIRVLRRDGRVGSEGSFVIDDVSGHGATDAPVELSMRGTLVDHPYTIRMDSGSLRGLFVQSPEAWPLEFSLEVRETRLHVKATIEEPLLAAQSVEELTAGEGRLGQIELRLEGERLDDLGELALVSLPHWGPWSFTGRFAAARGGLYDADVEVNVGSSALAGKMGLDLSKPVPEVDLALDATTIQLDDFRLEGWSPEEEQEEPAAPEDAAETGQAVRAFLSPETLSRLDGKLRVRVGRVLSGRDRLGRSTLAARLRGGVLEIEPWKVEVPGGEVELRGRLQPRRQGLRARLASQVENFDYGILARRIDPETPMKGRIYLDMDIESDAPRIEHILAHANGHLDVGVFPEEFQAGVIELWAVNLVMAVLPVIDRGSDSVLNCAVAGLEIEKGIMHQRSLMLDTSRMRVSGEAHIDFREETIRLELAPRAKRPQFFSLATPVGVNGTFDDFGVGVRAVDLVGTVIRLATSVIEVPGRYLIGDLLPADGTQDCIAALRRSDP